jgi:hypothetical protein
MATGVGGHIGREDREITGRWTGPELVLSADPPRLAMPRLEW